jgi:hypothetical protein
MSNKTDLENTCGFCCAKKSSVLYPTFDISGNHYFINQCQECNAIFLAPKPTPEQLSQAYDGSYYGEKEEKFASPMVEKVLDHFRSGRARRVSRHVPQNG